MKPGEWNVPQIWRFGFSLSGSSSMLHTWVVHAWISGQSEPWTLQRQDLEPRESEGWVGVAGV